MQKAIELGKIMMESVPCLVIGSAGIAVIQLTDMRDITTIAVGMVTIVCLIYNTFCLRNKHRKKDK